MIWDFPSPLLLYPEWIIFVLIVLQGTTLALLVKSWGILSRLRAELPGILECQDKIGRLEALGEVMRSDYEKLRASNEKLGREYAELWKEHQETCDLLGPMLPEDTENAPGTPGRASR